MTVIAMTREMGTGGEDVAAGLGETLGLEVVHHELIEHHLAERMALGDSQVHRFLEGQASLLDRWRIDPKRLSLYTAEEVLELAQRGNVLIRGWGAAQLLRDIAHVVCVRICAPMRQRAGTMMKRLAIEERDVVVREIERNDGAHTRTIQRLFDVDWRDPTHYDIVLNSGFVPVDTCVDLISRLAAGRAHAETAESRGRLAERLVEAKARTILDTVAPSGPIGSALSVEVRKGRLTLSGVVDRDAQLETALEKISKLSGVEEVDNKVQRLQHHYGV